MAPTRFAAGHAQVALLTLAWGGALLLGRCDLGPGGRAVPRTLTRGADLLTTGVTADADARARCWTWTYTLNSTATMYMTARRVTPQTHSPAQQHCHKLYDRKKGDPHRHTPLQHRAVHTLVDSFASSACASKSSCEHQHRCQVA